MGFEMALHLGFVFHNDGIDGFGLLFVLLDLIVVKNCPLALYMLSFGLSL